MKRLIVSLLSIVMFVFGVNASEIQAIRSVGGFAGQFDPDSASLAPEVKIDIAVKGRAYVISHLLERINYVTLYYRGRSLVTESKVELDRESLRLLGYANDGSATELFNALSKVEFNASLANTPDGRYDVNVDVIFWTEENTVAFKGSGNPIFSRGKGDILIADTFNVWAVVNEKIAIPIEKNNTGIIAAKWLNEVGRDTQLNINYRFDQLRRYIGQSIIIEDGMLGSGYLLTSNGSAINGVDLRTGSSIESERVFAYLGKISMPSVHVADLTEKGTNLNLNWKDLTSFYYSNGELFGRPPVIDFKTDEGIHSFINPEFNTWGLNDNVKITPKRIYIKPIFISFPTPSKRFTVGKYTELERDERGWSVDLPPGGYQIIMEFEGLHDWALDENPIG